MRSVCVTLLMLLVAKEGSCRKPGRTIPWPALRAEDGMPIMPVDTPQMPKMPEPPKRLRPRLASWELAERPMLAGVEGLPIVAPHPQEPRMIHRGALQHPTGLRRDRRFAPSFQPAVAQVPQMPLMPQMPPIPHTPSSGRRRRSPKGDKKDGQKDHKPEEKPEEMKEAKEKRGKL